MGLLDAVGGLFAPPDPGPSPEVYRDMAHNHSHAMYQQWVSERFSELAARIVKLEEQLREHLGGEE